MKSDVSALWELRRNSILTLAPKGMPVTYAQKWAAAVTLEGLEERLDRTEIWICEVNERMVGWVSFRDDYLDGLYVDSELAEQGIGTMLLRFAEGQMRARGVKVIRTEASWNAEDFYLRRGYEAAGPRPTDGARPLTKRLKPEKNSI